MSQLTVPKLISYNKTIFKNNIQNVTSLLDNSFSFVNKLLSVSQHKTYYKFIFNSYNSQKDISISQDQYNTISSLLFDVISIKDFPHRVIQPYDTSTDSPYYAVITIPFDSFHAHTVKDLFKDALESTDDFIYSKTDVFSLNNFFIISLNDILHKLNILPYSEVVTIFVQLWRQISYLELNGFTIPSIDPSRIIIFQGRPVYFFNYDELIPIIDNTKCNISIDNIISYSNTIHHSPELNKCIKDNMLPNLFYKTTVYYSIASISAHALFHDFDPYNPSPSLDKILDTKLFFALKRAFDTNPKTRKLLYI